MRTCAEKLQLQWERRRARLIASGGVPRERGAHAAAAPSADANAEAESGGNGEEAATIAMTTTTTAAGADSTPLASADGRLIGSEQGAGADAVPASGPEELLTEAAARAAARRGRAAAAAALGIQATQAYLTAELSVVAQALGGSAG